MVFLVVFLSLLISSVINPSKSISLRWHQCLSYTLYSTEYNDSWITRILIRLFAQYWHKIHHQRNLVTHQKFIENRRYGLSYIIQYDTIVCWDFRVTEVFRFYLKNKYDGQIMFNWFPRRGERGSPYVHLTCRGLTEGVVLLFFPHLVRYQKFPKKNFHCV